MITVKARAKAFTGKGIREYTFGVEDNGSVLVYDDIAKHFTSCHALSKSAIARIRKIAKD